MGNGLRGRFCEEGRNFPRSFAASALRTWVSLGPKSPILTRSWGSRTTIPNCSLGGFASEPYRHQVMQRLPSQRNACSTFEDAIDIIHANSSRCHSCVPRRPCSSPGRSDKQKIDERHELHNVQLTRSRWLFTTRSRREVVSVGSEDSLIGRCIHPLLVVSRQTPRSRTCFWVPWY
jgi:hypothetical protein